MALMWRMRFMGGVNYKYVIPPPFQDTGLIISGLWCVTAVLWKEWIQWTRVASWNLSTERQPANYFTSLLQHTHTRTPSGLQFHSHFYVIFAPNENKLTQESSFSHFIYYYAVWKKWHISQAVFTLLHKARVQLKFHSTVSQ